MERAEAEAILDGDRETAVGLLLRLDELAEANQRLVGANERLEARVAELERRLKRSSRKSMGHEAIGVVEDVGSQVTAVKKGDVVVMPFAISDGTCEFCQEGLPTACGRVGFFGNNRTNGTQAEALRIPLADGTLYPIDFGEDDALMPSLLTLSDVMGTGHHAVAAKVAPGHRVAVVGDGAVGLCGVIAAKRPRKASSASRS